GNGRAFLAPKAAGVPWELGAVSTAEWTGVPLAKVLEKAGVKDGAVDVVLEGGDKGERKDEPKPAGAFPFARGLPLAKAMKPEAGEAVPAGAAYRVRGAAWAGESEVAKVEISADGGKTWAEAKLLGEAVPFAWRLWEYAWKAPAEGKAVLLARATDRRGRVQP